jgi:thiosulfate dehydrogenase [quinone] large subunit
MMSLVDNLIASFTQRTSLGFLALIRIAVGYHFVDVAWPKVTGRFSGEGLAGMLLKSAPNNRSAWHREFIVEWVVPNADWFSYVVAYGELAIGVSLLTGCLVRLGSAFGAFHNLNIYLAVATGAQVGLNRVFIILHLIFIMAAAGRSLGLDGWLHRKFPRSPVF